MGLKLSEERKKGGRAGLKVSGVEGIVRHFVLWDQIIYLLCGYFICFVTPHSCVKL